MSILNAVDRADAVGMPGARVLHPLLSGRDFVIPGAAQVGGASSLAFDAVRVALQVPWKG
ncbi:hypothetical protein [uncultured Sphingomonas sp.]|uniref:hypothetical protein n=1 Tax=uncultured Sphingomonas sp. TaxID=158754 RepID=UPI0025E2F3E7|nr:hypothetical protein [uncultured Sphingomonas sp.]